MKTTLLLLIIFLFKFTLLFAQKKEDDDIKIKLIEYVVQIADTTNQINEIDLTEHQLNERNYFNLIDFKSFCTLLRSAMTDSSSIIADNNKPYNIISKKDLANNMLDTVIIVVPSMNDDEVNTYHNMLQEVNFTEPRFLKFYETWLINPETFEIKKEIIAYAPMFYDEKLNIFRSRYILFTNMKSYILFQELMLEIK